MPARIVGVEGDPHPCGVGDDQHGIAHGVIPFATSANMKGISMLAIALASSTLLIRSFFEQLGLWR
jgi:hypothetical protein